MEYELKTLVAVYLAFAAKHFLCDYVFQTGTMATCKGAEVGWARPLFAHAGVHAAATLAICLLVRPGFWWLSIVDLLVHAAIDRGKGVLTLRLQPSVPRYWQFFGADQLAHQLTHFAYVLVLAAP